MRILQLTVHYSPNIGGVETHLSDLVSGLVKLKHEVYVLTYRPLMSNAKWKIYEKSKKLQILRLPWFSGLFYTFVTKPIIEFIYLTPFLFVTTPFVILSFKPEVIHAHGLIAGFVAIFWGKIFRIRVVMSTHSLYQFPQRGLYKTFAKLIFNNADAVLCLSDKSVKEITDLGVPKNKVTRFTYWVDLDLFKKVKNAKKKLNWENKFIVLFVGRLVEEKGIPELIGASELLNKDIVITIAGAGPMEQEIKNNLSEHLIYLGKINQKKLPLYYSASDVVIVPSTHEEGFGRVIIEALACGTPVIASDRGSIREAMNDSVGEFIKITPQNISKTVIKYQKNLRFLYAKSNNARRFVLKLYSEKNIKEIIDDY
jgi:glycosyltransferase involved in cell wall biosynthesis